MKYLNKLTRVLVDFHPAEHPVPAFFLYEGHRVKVDRVISQTQMRKTFDRCTLYKCEAANQTVELRWDRDRDKWYIEKMGE